MEIDKEAIRTHNAHANEVFLIYESFFPQLNLSASRKCGLISALSRFQTLPECSPRIENQLIFAWQFVAHVIRALGNLGPALNFARKGTSQAC
jgi:hypothetical protein